MAVTLIDESNEQQVFSVLNMAVLPIWAAMILAPNSALTEKIVAKSNVVLAGYSAAYAVQLGLTVAGQQERPDFQDVAKLREGMGLPAGFLTGWTHFLAFDLFVGRWIWQTAKAEGRTARLATLLTFVAGPAGLGVFGLQRRSLRNTA